jgi:tousled-like kinase
MPCIPWLQCGQAFDLNEQRYVACKIHRLNANWEAQTKSEYSRKAVREYNIQRSLNHPHCVPLFDAFEIESCNSFYTVLAYCQGGDLDWYLKVCY